MLFGDGAGAVVLRATETESQGILSTHLHSDGNLYDLLYVDGGPSTTGLAGHLRMEGKEVFRHAVHRLSEVVVEALIGASTDATRYRLAGAAPGQSPDHRRASGRKLALPADRVVVTVDRHANTSAASIPLALDEAVRDGRIKRGDMILLLEAFGGGLTWGAALIRW